MFLFLNYSLSVVFSWFHKFSWVFRNEMGPMRPYSVLATRFDTLTVIGLYAKYAGFKDVLYLTYT
jgi:hypothetical protein